MFVYIELAVISALDMPCKTLGDEVKLLCELEVETHLVDTRIHKSATIVRHCCTADKWQCIAVGIIVTIGGVYYPATVNDARA